MAVERFIQMHEGDSYTESYQWLSNGVPVDLTGYTVVLTVRTSYDTGGTAAQTMTGTIATPANGTAAFNNLLTLNDGNYVYDVVAKQGSTYRKTLAYGAFKVLPRVGA